MKLISRSSFLKRLIGIAGLGQVSLQEAVKFRKIYLLQCFVAGFRFHKGMQLLQVMAANDLVELRREPDNSHDRFAVALYWQQEMIGYLPAEFNETIARLMDASALPLLGVITHLNTEVKPWENLVVAVFFLQPETPPLPQRSAYLTQLAKPDYRTLPKKEVAPASTKNKRSARHDDVFDLDNRVIAIDDVTDNQVKQQLEEQYGKYEKHIGGKRYLQVPDDGIYNYLYRLEVKDWLLDEQDREWLEFVINPE